MVIISDETRKRITILPEKLNDDAKLILKRLFDPNLNEVDAKVANGMLVASSPKDSATARAAFIRHQQQHLSATAAASNSKKPGGVGSRDKQANAKYCQFPLSGLNAVSLYAEDYVCLEDESFLNDVIIDFYLRYLQFKLISERDRDRTHIFTTFFYNRLTTRPKTMRNRVHTVEDNPNLTPALKRYDRVKRWTKSVNIFEKDFVIVPINEQ